MLSTVDVLGAEWVLFRVHGAYRGWIWQRACVDRQGGFTGKVTEQACKVEGWLTDNTDNRGWVAQGQL